MDDITITKYVKEFKNSFIGEKNTAELINAVKNVMPDECNDYKVQDVTGTLDKFVAKVFVNIDNEEGFIKSYCDKNNESLRIQTINKSSRFYRCKHKTRHKNTMEIEQYVRAHPNKRVQNTNCPFSLSLKDQYTENADYNALLEIQWKHNHSTTSLHSLTFKDIGVETKAKIEKLFHAGLLPGAAHKDLIRQLRSECGSVLEFEERLADRSVIPRKPDMNRLYGLFTKEIFGNNSIENMFATLEARIDQLMESGIIYSSKLQKFDEKTSQPLILVVVTPLMKRVHEMVQNAKDLIFVDSSSNMEEFNLRVFIVVTHSVCGALPLGIIFTSDEQGKTLQTAFELYKETVSPYGFYGSLTGPSVVMTDNCDELRGCIIIYLAQYYFALMYLSHITAGVEMGP